MSIERKVSETCISVVDLKVYQLHYADLMVKLFYNPEHRKRFYSIVDLSCLPFIVAVDESTFNQYKMKTQVKTVTINRLIVSILDVL